MLPEKARKANTLLLSPEYLSKTIGIDWPTNMGFVKGSEKPLHYFAKKFVRMGYIGGKNVSNEMHTFQELALPYEENLGIMSTGTFNNYLFRNKIDAIRTCNFQKLNQILRTQKIKPVTKSEFAAIVKDNDDYLNNLFKTGIYKHLSSFYYGVVGKVANWIEKESNKELAIGGACQIYLPLGCENLIRIGALKLDKE